MDIDRLKGNIRKLVVQRNVFLLFSLLLGCGVVLLSLLLFSKSERIVIVPTAGPSFWVENSRVSASYLESMGMYMSELLLNRSPADVESKNRVILDHVHPAFYHEIRKQLAQERENLVKQGQSFMFRAQTSRANVADYTFSLEGEWLVFVGKQGEKPTCAQVERRRYVLGFQCQNNRMLLVSLKKEEL